MAHTVGDYVVDLTYELGQGAKGMVYEAHIKDDEKQKVAAKRISLLNEKEYIDIVEQEFNIMKKLSNNDFIARVFAVEKVVNPRDHRQIHIWMFMELCSLDNLNKFCRENKLNIPQKVAIMCQCADAVLFLHNQSIVHRDIKPENILLTGDRTKPTVKLTDFGEARALERIHGREKTMHSFVGTQSYMAPELFSQIENDTPPSYDKTTDIFSLGLTYLAMTEAQPGSELHSYKVGGKALGKHLWNTKENIENIMKPDDPNFQRELKEIFTKMLKVGPSERLSMEHVLHQLQEIQTFFSEPILMTAGGHLGENGIPTACNNDISVNKNNQWLNITTRPDVCQTMGVMICAVGDGLLYIGGDIPDDGGVPVAQCHYYSLFYEHWRQMADIPTPRSFGTAIAIQNIVYVLGGLGTSSPQVATSQKLDVRENKWDSLCDMIVPMIQPYIAIAKDRIFVVPSWLSRHKSSVRKLCILCYDPASDTFTQKSQMPDDIFINGGSMVSVNEMLYLFGAAENKFHQYNPDSDQWTAITKPSMQTTWTESNAAVRGTKIVLFHDTKAEEYDTTNDSWSLCTTRLPQMMTDYTDLKYCCFTSYLNV